MEKEKKTYMQFATKKYRRQRDDIDNDDSSEVEKKTRPETPKRLQTKIQQKTKRSSKLAY